MGKRFLDQYSILHFSQGIIAYFWGTPPIIWFVTHATYEFLENSGPGMELINKIPFWPGGKPEADSPMNILGDNISAAAGYWFAKAIDGR